jgi:hypothetical protein
MTSHFQAYDPTVKPPYLRPQYPRLREEESQVLRGYLSETGTDTVSQLRTAVPVGEGEVRGDPQNVAERQRKALSQFKIDAVVDRPNKQEIIELKSRATHTAVGQVLAYDLYLGERADEPTNSRPVVAAFREHPDLGDFARAVGVETHMVPQMDPSTATERFLQDVDRLDGD